MLLTTILTVDCTKNKLKHNKSVEAQKNHVTHNDET